MDIEKKNRYGAHVFICTKCKICKKHPDNFLLEDKNEDALDFRNRLKKMAKERFPEGNVRINISGCLAACETGINAVIYPQNVWIKNLERGNEEKVLSLVENILREELD